MRGYWLIGWTVVVRLRPSGTTGLLGSVAAELPGSVGVEQLGVRVRGVGDHRGHCVGHLLPLRAHA